MRRVVISPHTDDAIFSIGSFISEWNDVVIVSPFAGIPNDKVGKKKHTTLRKEHEKACKIIGASFINGDFLDDVYPDRDISTLYEWFKDIIKPDDWVYIPMGIHHPDHIIVRDIFINTDLRFNSFYSELPYRELYPHLAEKVTTELTFHRRISIAQREWTFFESRYSNDIKKQAVQAYKSQIVGGHILPHLFVDEHIW